MNFTLAHSNFDNKRLKPCPLVVRFGHLGDVVLTTGVLSYYGKLEGKKFDVLTRPENSDIFIGHPFVNRVVTFPKGLSFVKEFSFFQALSQYYAGQDLVDLHGNFRAYLLRKLWKGTIYSYNKMSIPRRLFALSHGFFCGEELRAYNVPQRYAKAFAGNNEIPSRLQIIPQIVLSSREKKWARDVLVKAYPSLSGVFSYGKEESICNSLIPPIALHPFASHAPKTWSKEKWLELVCLLDKKRIPWITLGKGENFFEETGQNFINKCSLRESAALLSECRALVTGDSGPMHLASAVGTSVVALFGPTTKEWGFFPADDCVILEPKIECRPCSLHGKSSCEHPCLEQISPEQVLESLVLF